MHLGIPRQGISQYCIYDLQDYSEEVCINLQLCWLQDIYYSLEKTKAKCGAKQHQNKQ